MTVLAFLALWVVAGVAVVLVFCAMRAHGDRQDTEALELFDDWDHQSGGGGW